MRQIKTIIDRTPEGFDAQVNAAIQEIGSEHLREVRTLMSTTTELTDHMAPSSAVGGTCAAAARATRRWGATTSADQRWGLKALIARRGQNRAAVAVANQNTRIAWALPAHYRE